MILSSRYQAITLSILLPFILYLRRAKEKEHRRNHAHLRPGRAFWDVKAKRCSFRTKVVRVNRSLVRKQHKIAAVLPVETKSTEPSKRFFKYKLVV